MRLKVSMVPFLLIGLASTFAFAADSVRSDAVRTGNPETDRIIQGYQITPVRLVRSHRDRDLLGLGSYLVNAVGGCNDCHTNPPYAPGGDPFQGEPKKINVDRFLAGGTPFGPVTSKNITPDENGLPAGLTFSEFREALRTGHDPDEPGEILQVMPWPVFQNMTDRDLRAIYEYLRSIPHRD